MAAPLKSLLAKLSPSSPKRFLLPLSRPHPPQPPPSRYSVNADLITSVIAAKSNFDPKAISRRNARGLMQLLPETAARLGVQNIFDPQENIDGGTRYLRELLQRYSNDLAL